MRTNVCTVETRQIFRQGGRTLWLIGSVTNKTWKTDEDTNAESSNLENGETMGHTKNPENLENPV